MKLPAFLFFIFLLPMFSFAQETSIFSLGIGSKFFFQKEFNSNSGRTHRVGPGLNVIVEKPGLFTLHKNPIYSVTPGFNYSEFKENNTSNSHGGGINEHYKHRALSFYSKILYEPNFAKERIYTLYTGILAGVYLLTKTNGNSFSWMSQEGGSYATSSQINQNGKTFFHSFYAGILLGIKPKIRTNSFVNPALEFSFHPNYATILDSYKPPDDQNSSKSVAMITITIGFGKKKATQINE